MYSFPTTRVGRSLSATTSQLRIAARRAQWPQSVSHHSQLRVVGPVHTTQFLQESAGCSRRHKLPLPQLVLSWSFHSWSSLLCFRKPWRGAYGASPARLRRVFPSKKSDKSWISLNFFQRLRRLNLYEISDPHSPTPPPYTHHHFKNPS